MASPESAFPHVDLLLLLAGQSNMAGRGDVKSTAYTSFLKNGGSPGDDRERILLFKSGSWLIGPSEPLHSDKPGRVGVGPGLAAALTITRSSPKARVGIVPAAFGGSEIGRWLPPDGDLLLQCQGKLDAALSTLRYHPQIVLLWHQGESDCTNQRAENYRNRLLSVLNYFTRLLRRRTERRWSRFAIVVGQLGHFLDLPGADSVRKSIASLRDFGSRGAHQAGRFLHVVGAQGLCHQGDSLHFDAKSYVELGIRYGRVVVEHMKAADATGDSKVLYDFSNKKAAGLFQARDDRIMGGKSRSALIYVPPLKDGVGATLLTGDMVLEGGGFASLRSGLDLASCQSLAEFAGICVDCRSGEDGKSFLLSYDDAENYSRNHSAAAYRIALGTNASMERGVYWSCMFRPGPNRGKHLLSFSHFFPRRRGRRTDSFPQLSRDILEKVTTLTILLSRGDNPGFQGGSFRLFLFSINVFGSGESAIKIKEKDEQGASKSQNAATTTM